MEMVMYLLFVVFGLGLTFMGRLEDDLIFVMAGALLLIFAGIATYTAGIATTESFLLNTTGSITSVTPTTLYDTAWYVSGLSLLWILSGFFGFLHYVFQKIRSVGEEIDGKNNKEKE